MDLRCIQLSLFTLIYDHKALLNFPSKDMIFFRKIDCNREPFLNRNRLMTIEPLCVRGLEQLPSLPPSKISAGLHTSNE